MSTVLDKPITDMTANDLLALSRDRSLNLDELHQARSLLDNLINLKSTRPLKTPELVSMERLKTLLPENADTMSAAPEQSGSIIGNEIEKGFNQAVPDKDAFLIPFSSIIEVSNPRKSLKNIPELANAIRHDGRINHPLTVEKIEGGYRLIGGHRRKAANGLLVKDDPIKWAMVPVRLRQPENFAVAQLLDNMHREDLPPIDEANAFKEFMEQFDCDQKTLAEKLSVSVRHVSDRLALLKLPEDAQHLINSGEVAPNSKFAKKMIEQAKAGKTINLEAMTTDATPTHASEKDKGRTKSKTSADAQAVARAPKIAISKESAVALCELLILLTGKKRDLIKIDLSINNKSPKKDIISILEQRPFDVLEAYK